MTVGMVAACIIGALGWSVAGWCAQQSRQRRDGEDFLRRWLRKHMSDEHDVNLPEELALAIIEPGPAIEDASLAGYLLGLSKRWEGPCCPTCGLPSFNVDTADGRKTSVRCPCETLS